MDETLPPDQPKVFLSYSRRDRERAQLIADELRERAFGVFKDTDDILPTEEWRGRLEQLIEEADTIVFLLSPHSANSEVCAWEVEYANSLNKRIAPIVIDETDTDEIPPILTKLNFIFCTERDPFEDAVDTLISALNTNIEWVREHTRLNGLARRWHLAERSDTLLLRGQDIADAETWRDTRPADAPSVTQLQAAFISASRYAAVRRQRFLVIGSMAILTVTAGLAIFAWFQSVEAMAKRDEALVTESRFLANRAMARAKGGDQSSAIEIALMGLPNRKAGIDRPYVATAESALRFALSDLREEKVFDAYKGEDGWAFNVSGNGKYVSVSQDRSIVRVYKLDDLTTTMEIKVPLNSGKIHRTRLSYFLTGLSYDGGVVSIKYYEGDSTSDKEILEFWKVGESKPAFKGAGYNRIAISPDNRFAAAGYSYSTQTVYGNEGRYGLDLIDLNSGDVRRLDDYYRDFNELAFSPDSQQLLFKTAKLINGRSTTTAWVVGTKDTKPPVALSVEGKEVLAAIWSPRGNIVAVSYEDQIVRLWKWHTQTIIREIQTKAKVFKLNFSRGGTLLVTSGNNEANIWDVKNGIELLSYVGTRKFAFSPKQNIFAIWGLEKGQIELFAFPAMTRIKLVRSANLSIRNALFSQDGAKLIAQSDKGSFHMWSVGQAAFAQTLPGGSRSVRQLEFSSDSRKLIASTGLSREQFVWEVESGKELGSSLFAGKDVGGGGIAVFDEGIVATNCVADAPWRLLKWSGGEDRTFTPPGLEKENSYCLSDIKVSPDNRVFAYLFGNKLLMKERNTDAKAIEFNLPGFTGNFKFSTNSRKILVTSQIGYGNGALALIDIASGINLPLEYDQNGSSSYKAVFGADGRKIFMPLDEKIKIWDTENGKVLGYIPNFKGSVDWLRPFSDGKRMLVVRNENAWVVDIESGRTLNSLKSPDDISTFDLSSDERLLAAGDWGKQSVRIWDLETGEQKALLSGLVVSDNSSSNGVNVVQFSPDGKWIAAGSDNGNVRLWRFHRELDEVIEMAKSVLPRRIPKSDLDIFDN